MYLPQLLAPKRTVRHALHLRQRLGSRSQRAQLSGRRGTIHHPGHQTLQVIHAGKSVPNLEGRPDFMPVRAPTPFCRRVISRHIEEGLFERLSDNRFPIAVLVLSSTHNRLPRFSLCRIVSVISRFLRAVMSIFMYWLVR